jgi:SH3-like domain-containing protein
LQVLTDPYVKSKIVALWKNGVGGIRVIGTPGWWSKVERKGVRGWVLTQYLTSNAGSATKRAANTAILYIPQGVRMELRRSPGYVSSVQSVIQSGTYSYEVIEYASTGGDNWVKISVAGYTGWLSQNGLNRVKR